MSVSVVPWWGRVLPWACAIGGRPVLVLGTRYRRLEVDRVLRRHRTVAHRLSDHRSERRGRTMSAMSRRKGARAEVDVVNWLRSVGSSQVRPCFRGTMTVAGRCANSPGRGLHLAGGAVMAQRTCSINGCEDKHYGRGLCSKHYQWHARRGIKPDVGRPTVEQRFWSKIEKQHGGCWVWVGTVLASGYGQFRTGHDRHRAHRFSYELLVGPIPDGLTIDHLCRNTRCVNPDHLEPVTARENILRAKAARR